MNLEHEKRGDVSHPEGTARRRARYQKPKVVEFGDVRELTKGSGGSKGDIGGMPHK